MSNTHTLFSTARRALVRSLTWRWGAHQARHFCPQHLHLSSECHVTHKANELYRSRRASPRRCMARETHLPHAKDALRRQHPAPPKHQPSVSEVQDVKQHFPTGCIWE